MVCVLKQYSHSHTLTCIDYNTFRHLKRVTIVYYHYHMTKKDSNEFCLNLLAETSYYLLFTAHLNRSE